MTRLSIYITLVVALISCASQKNKKTWQDIRYNSEYGYKNLYIVDTLILNNPVAFHTTDDYLIITEKETFLNNKDYTKSILKKDGFYLFSTCYTIEYSLPDDIVDKLNLEECTKVLKLFKSNTTLNTTLNVTECSKPLKFILLLVSKNYYNRAFTALDGPPSICDNNDNDYLYYKVLVPYFESNKKSGLMTPSDNDP